MLQREESLFLNAFCRISQRQFYRTLVFGISTIKCKTHKVFFRPLLILAGVLVLQAPQAQAELLRVIQEWDSVNVATDGKTARTAATIEPGTLNGVGFERLPIDNFFLGRSLNGIGQSSATLQSNPPLEQNIGGTVFAAYLDGVFQGLRSLDTGGSASAALDDLNTPQVDNGGAVLFGDGTMIFFIPISGQENYVLTQTELVVIPEPATLVLLGASLFGCGLLRRRSH